MPAGWNYVCKPFKREGGGWLERVCMYIHANPVFNHTSTPLSPFLLPAVSLGCLVRYFWFTFGSLISLIGRVILPKSDCRSKHTDSLASTDYKYFFTTINHVYTSVAILVGRPRCMHLDRLKWVLSVHNQLVNKRLMLTLINPGVFCRHNSLSMTFWDCPAANVFPSLSMFLISKSSSPSCNKQGPSSTVPG